MVAQPWGDSKDESSSTLPTLPHDMMEEILAWLPAKSLIRFRRVCSLWNSLVSDPHFARKHADNLASKAKDIFVSICNDSSIGHQNEHVRQYGVVTTSQYRLKSCCIHSLYNEPFIDISEHDQELVGRDYYHMVGTCNGLICFNIDDRKMYLWNPMIKTYTRLPDPAIEVGSGGCTTHGFGYDQSICDYKVVVLFHRTNQATTQAKLYSVREKSWRNIEGFPSSIAVEKSRPGIYVNGALNWAATCSLPSSSLFTILSYDLSSNTFKELSQSVCPNGCFTLTLGELGGCLSMVCYCRGSIADVWVMTEFGDGASWMKLVGILGLAEYVRPLWISKGCEILLEFRSGLALYDCRKHMFRYPIVDGLKCCRNAKVYVETLISPDVP